MGMARRRPDARGPHGHVAADCAPSRGRADRRRHPPRMKPVAAKDRDGRRNLHPLKARTAADRSAAISLEQLRRTLSDPDRTEPDRDDTSATHALKRFHVPGGSVVLRVVYNHTL